MRKITILFILFSFGLSLYSEAQNYFWVAFKNKDNTKYSLSSPREYLSERAIQRREKQNIAIDSLDLPVNANYIDSVLTFGAQLVHSSKWLNGITVKTSIDTFKTSVQKISFVKEVLLSKPGHSSKSAFNKFNEPETGNKDPIDTSLYGESVYQTGLMNGQFIHNNGFNGQGMQIAVIDAGFYKANELAAFDSLWANNQIIGTKDFVNSNDDFYATHYHGMSVLSCMGGNIPGNLIGTARKASYWLLRTEDTSSEYPIEEDNWVAAAEFADSAGVDVINSSLGYYEFDDSTLNHTYADMDGKTTRVTRGANIAFSRGILVVVAAGNERQKAWQHIIAPADGNNVLAVGATNKFGFDAPFTSLGPASDGDIKPNVAAVGWNTYLQLRDGNLGFASGTSFASPIMAGMATSFWQSMPNATAADVKRAIEMSASQYEKPDSILGFGIPDFKKAWTFLVNQIAEQNSSYTFWTVYPNPATNYFVLKRKSNSTQKNIKIEIYSIEGRLLRNWTKQDKSQITITNIDNLPRGILLVRIHSENFTQTIKLNKI